MMLSCKCRMSCGGENATLPRQFIYQAVVAIYIYDEIEADLDMSLLIVLRMDSLNVSSSRRSVKLLSLDIR